MVYIWYNTQFLQHQGRYLFTALIPIAIFFSLGWEGVLRPGAGRILAALLVGIGFGLATWGSPRLGNGLPKWPLALTAAFAAGLLILDLGLRSRARTYRRNLHERRCTERNAAHSGPMLHPLAFALPFVMLPLLDCTPCSAASCRS